jgi:TonB family protein
MGSSYLVLRKEGEKWLSLPGATVWTLELHWVPSNKIYPFPISLYPSLNAITPGVYRVVKKIDIGNNCHNWYFTAEFRIGNGTEEQDILNKEPSSKPLSEVEEETDMDIAYEVVEEMPEYPGGMSALLDFIQNNLQHDKANSPKRVIVQFIIDERGNISKPIILRSINPELDKEALRIVSLMPQWKPGRQNGKAERVRYTLPIIFNPSIKESDMIE